MSGIREEENTFLTPPQAKVLTETVWWILGSGSRREVLRQLCVVNLKKYSPTVPGLWTMPYGKPRKRTEHI